jgi:4-carboxymuconolactone decarboxylase
MLVSLTDDVLFDGVWRRPSPLPGRSLITVAGRITGGNTEQLPAHLGIAEERANRDRAQESHPAFYAGWPMAMPAIGFVKQAFDD